MPITIDHTTHPHIIDLIVDASPRDSLLKLRATSRAFRDRADKLLCAHVVVSPVPRENSVHVFTPSDTHPFVADAGVRLPFVPDAVLTLDICSSPEGADLVPGIALAQFSNLRTLRRFGREALVRPYGIIERVDTVVDSVVIPWVNPYLSIYVNITFAPPARRRVLHVHFDEDSRSSPLMLSPAEGVRLTPSVVGELTIILWPHCSHRTPRPSDLQGPLGPSLPDNPWDYRHFTQVLVLIRALGAFPRLGGSVTMVGLERCHLRNAQTSLRPEERTLPNDEFQDFASLFSEWLGVYLQAEPNISFLTYSQWLDTLSDDDKIILSPPGPGSPG